MADTTRLALPYLAAAQSQKHVTHNEALRMLDALVQVSVLAQGVNDPPANPAEGDRVIVGPSPTGLFAGRAGCLAAFDDGAWRFFQPRAGWLALDAGSASLLVHDGAAWQEAGQFVRSLDGVDRLGIGTAGDARNSLSAKLNSALFAARPADEGGTGDLRVVYNKPLPAATLSLLFQANWSGRAEIGLLGDESFRIRSSADGQSWREAIIVDAATGAVRFPSGIAEAGPQPLAAFRNHVINGDFSVAQRGSGPFDVTGSPVFGFDRWLAQAIGSATGSVSRSSFGARAEVPGGRFFATLQVRSLAAGARVEWLTRLEEASRLAGRQVTISFYYRTAVAGIALELGQSLAGGTATPALSWTTSLPAASSWRRFSATVTLPQLTGPAAAGSYTLVRLAMASAGSLDLALMQLEEGGVATPFERRMPAIELLLCRRFFRRSAAAQSPADLGQEMRAVPVQTGSDPYDYSAEL